MAAAFKPIGKLTDEELTAAFKKYDALDPSSAGMDANEFGQMLRSEFKIDANDEEIKKEYDLANNDDSADAMGEDMCCDEFIKWAQSKR